MKTVQIKEEVFDDFDDEESIDIWAVHNETLENCHEQPVKIKEEQLEAPPLYQVEGDVHIKEESEELNIMENFKRVKSDQIYGCKSGNLPETKAEQPHQTRKGALLEPSCGMRYGITPAHNCRSSVARQKDNVISQIKSKIKSQIQLRAVNKRLCRGYFNNSNGVNKFKNYMWQDSGGKHGNAHFKIHYDFFPVGVDGVQYNEYAIHTCRYCGFTSREEKAMHTHLRARHRIFEPPDAENMEGEITNLEYKMTSVEKPGDSHLKTHDRQLALDTANESSPGSQEKVPPTSNCQSYVMNKKQPSQQTAAASHLFTKDNSDSQVLMYNTSLAHSKYFMELTDKNRNKYFGCLRSKCNYVSTNIYDLQYHLWRKHSYQIKHKCKFCDFTAMEPKDVRDHRRKLHGIYGPLEFTNYDMILSDLKGDMGTSNKKSMTTSPKLNDEAIAAAKMHTHTGENSQKENDEIMPQTHTKDLQKPTGEISQKRTAEISEKSTEDYSQTHPSEKRTKHTDESLQMLTGEPKSTSERENDVVSSCLTSPPPVSSCGSKKSSSKLLKCQVCNFLSHSEVSFLSHLAKHKELRFKCSYCDYRSPRCRNVISHLNWTHKIADAAIEKVLTVTAELPEIAPESTRYKKFQCHECRFQTDTLPVIKRHMLKHRPNPDEGKLKCQLCRYASHHPSNLSKHEKIMHPENF